MGKGAGYKEKRAAQKSVNGLFVRQMAAKDEAGMLACSCLPLALVLRNRKRKLRSAAKCVAVVQKRQRAITWTPSLYTHSTPPRAPNNPK